MRHVAGVVEEERMEPGKRRGGEEIKGETEGEPGTRRCMRWSRENIKRRKR